MLSEMYYPHQHPAPSQFVVSFSSDKCIDKSLTATIKLVNPLLDCCNSVQTLLLKPLNLFISVIFRYISLKSFKCHGSGKMYLQIYELIIILTFCLNPNKTMKLNCLLGWTCLNSVLNKLLIIYYWVIDWLLTHSMSLIKVRVGE